MTDHPTTLKEAMNSVAGYPMPCMNTHDVTGQQCTNLATTVVMVACVHEHMFPTTHCNDHPMKGNRGAACVPCEDKGCIDCELTIIDEQVVTSNPWPIA